MLAVRLELSHQLIQPHDAHFRVFQRLEVQQVIEFFFVLLFRFLLKREQHFPACSFQNVPNVFGAGLSRFAMLRVQPPAQLIDLRERPFRSADLPCCLKDQIFLRFLRIRHQAVPLRGLACAFFLLCACVCVCFCVCFSFCGGGGGGGGSAGSPASRRRYFVTFRLCSASVALKKCPPCVFATK